MCHLGKKIFFNKLCFQVTTSKKNIVYSNDFQKLLLTDASTKDGQDFLADYYKIDDWVQIKQKLNDEEVNMASRYYYLLFMVKAQSKQDNVLISFYEGLH